MSKGLSLISALAGAFGSFYNSGNQQIDPVNSSWYGQATDDDVNDFLTHWFSPGSVQDKEFAQQMYQIDYQNAYNDPAAQMERYRKAGINLNTAAAGVAGSPNTSATPSAVPQTPQGITPSDIASIGNALTGGAASLADAAFKFGTLNPTIQNLTADYDKKLAELGLTTEQIQAWKIDNKYREQNALSDLLTKSLNQENLRQQYKVYESTYQLQLEQADNLIKEREVMAADINNKEAQKLYFEALAQKTSLEAQWQQTRNEFWQTNGFDIMASTVDAILVQKLENGEDISSLTQGLAKYNHDVTYQTNRGALEAQEEKAWSIAYNQLKASKDLDVEFADWANSNEAFKSQLVKLAETMIPEGGSLEETLSQILVMFGNKSSVRQINGKNVDIPKQGPKY